MSDSDATDYLASESSDEDLELFLGVARQKNENYLGVIDGCHLKIDKPQNDADSYINRKGFYSIQMQVVCDHNRKIRDVFIGYPGSVHDARVFRNSPLCANLEEMCDRGQLTPQQINYNVQLSKNRYVIEHTFGILKQKFRQLYHIKLRDVVFIAHLIRAACVLHNVCINDEFEFDANYVVQNNILPPQIDVNDDAEVEDVNIDARRIRQHFVTILRPARN
ncbi:hypothetical protein RN001_009411 [Aquatica leii]|uniref:DDE Tnp4 domain-containing protein n=1 Tax=Aquatica leii TaxID=1421715 RepID=A0AAN7Q2G6_9COLE|nr:hypothetical protein RN001_009411 [Aquatica leii]